MFLRKITLFGLGVEATINGSSGACDFSGAQGVWVFNGAVDSELSLHVETRHFACCQHAIHKARAGRQDPRYIWW